MKPLLQGEEARAFYMLMLSEAEEPGRLLYQLAKPDNAKAGYFPDGALLVGFDNTTHELWEEEFINETYCLEWLNK